MSDNIIVLSDRTKELSRSTGTMPFVLDGAATGFSSFGDFYASGDAVFYAATDGTDYEVGSGQYLPDGSSNSLTRFPFRSTNSDNAVSFAEGIKEVYVTYPGKYSVFTASGLSNFQEPKASGIAFWGSSQILCHDHNLTWNPSGDRLGISQADPEYAIHVGGEKSYSQIRASGFLDGGSGILFSGVAGSYSGGRQLEPFLRNQVDNTTGTDAVISLSGLVDQRLLFVKQVKGTVFAGPVSGCVSAGCSPDYPTFRYLTQADLPILPYIAQYNDANPNVDGAIALYKSSGVAKYDNLFKFDDDSNRLGVNTASPNATLDVFGDVQVSGSFTSPLVVSDGLESSNTHIKIGSISGSVADSYSTSIGYEAGSGVTTSFFASDTIGYRAGYYVKNVDYSSMIGCLAGYKATGVENSLMVGLQAGAYAHTFESSIAIGYNAGHTAVHNGYCEMIGYEAGKTSSGNIGSTFIGYQAGYEGSGIEDSAIIGYGAGFDIVDVKESTIIGKSAARRGSGISDCFIAGKQAGLSGVNFFNNVMIGSYAGRQASPTYDGVSPDLISMGSITGSNFIGKNAGETWFSGGNYNNAIGYVAGNRASGSYNTYIGYYAGLRASGNNNIEIISHAVNVSEGHGATGRWGLIGGESPQDHKINIGNTIVGDHKSKLIAIGNVTRDHLVPNATLEIVPSAVLNVAFRISSKTGHTANLFEAVSGDSTTVLAAIDPSGSISTSGTISASGGILLNDLVPNATAGRLYNDGGALKWGSSTLDLDGGSTFKFHDGQDDRGVDPILNGQTIVISGISGIVTAYRPDMNLLTVSPHGLSGVIDTKIVNVSGWISGTIGALPGGYVDWKISDGTATGDTIVSHEVVNISGASGINTFWDSALNRLEITASGLSGVLQPQIDALGDGGGTVTAGSGITLVNGEINFDINGSGQLEHLIFNDDQIRIGTGAGDSFDLGDDGSYWTAIGYQAGYGNSGSDYTNIIGYQVGAFTSGIDYTNMIGYQAGTRGAGYHSVNIIGRQAGYEASGMTYANIVGTYAGYRATGCTHSNIIGINAGFQANNSVDTNMFGSNAGYQATGCNNSNMIGNFVGYKASGNSYINMIGNEAGRLSKECAYGNMFGHQAGYGAVHCYSTNMVGSGAGYEASGCSRTTMIGTEAGFRASGCDYGIMLGDQAGGYASGCLSTTMIGSGAGYQSSGNDYCDIIGYEAGKLSRNNDLTSIIGFQAGYESVLNSSNNFIGSRAGSFGSGNTLTNMIGYNAGFYSQTCASSNIFGHEAGYNASGNNFTNMIGMSAGEGSSGCSNTNMIGVNTSFYSYDCDYSNIIGSFAGQHAYKCNNDVFIGSSAGANATGVDYSINLGYYAGYERQGSNSLILKTSSTTSNGGASWAISSQDYLIDIAGIINGMSQDVGTTPVIRELRLGKPPSSAGDLSNVCTSIMPVSPADVTLKLDRATSQSASLLQSVNAGSATVDIVDKDGYLTIPVVTNVDVIAGTVHTGSPASTANEVTKSNGRIAAYNIGGTEYLLVCLGTTWYQTAELTAL